MQDQPDTQSSAENFAQLAMSAQFIVNAADSILRGGRSGLGLSDWTLLKRLADTPEGESMVQIGVRMGVSRQRIQKQVEKLAAANYVVVEISRDDKRLRNVTLASRGKEALARISTMWSDSLAQSSLAPTTRNLAAISQRMIGISKLLGKVARVEQGARGNAKQRPH